MISGSSTHEVFNQTPDYDGINLYQTDRALRASVLAEGANWGEHELIALGNQLGTKEEFHRGHLANKFPPELTTFDPKGFRADHVEFHADYHHFMALSKSNRIHCGAFDALAQDGRRGDKGVGVLRAAKHYMVSQVEAGHVCPITMTHAAIPAVQQQSDIAETWLPKLLSLDYDPALKPAQAKTGVTIGMGMTEKQGGTDVRTNTTRAVPVSKKGGGAKYLLTGHKWFMSAPMCDAFLVLAQAESGLSVFLVPRFQTDGDVNHLHFLRLKNKLGNRSNASSEVEFHQAEGFLLGEEGRGVANIMTMANYTRLDCALGSSGQMRQALSRAHHHAQHRTVFQRKLIDQPMMTALLADLTIESEAATLLAMRLASAYEGQAAGDAQDAAIARVLTPVIKYWVTKRAPGFTYEAMECLGGNGYVEDSIMARLYRDVPVNSIWEGSGSVMCLDLLRVIEKEKSSLDRVLNWLDGSRGDDPVFDKSFGALRGGLTPANFNPSNGRRYCEQFATLTAAKLLMERAPDPIATAYLATRLAPEGRAGAYGVLPAETKTRDIISLSFSA